MGRPSKTSTDVGGDLESRILSAGLRNFAEYGFSAASMRVIASEVGATAPMINYYFGSKADLYRRIVDKTVESLRAKVGVESDPSRTFEASLVHLARSYVEFAASSPDELRLYFRSALGGDDVPPSVAVDELRSEGFRDVRDLIATTAATGRFAFAEPSGPDDLVAHVIATIEYVGSRELLRSEPIDAATRARAADQVERMILGILRGLRAEGGER